MSEPTPQSTCAPPLHNELPAPGVPSDLRWGSDAIADMLQALDLPYLALNPGASYRGLHDSIVNHLGNRRPQMLLCREEGLEELYSFTQNKNIHIVP